MKNQSGFTLIETLLYLLLLGLIMSGVLGAAFTMIELAGRNQTKALVQEEGNFLLGKINWVMSGAQTISQPAAGSPGTTVAVTKFDSTTVTISLSGSNLQQGGVSFNNSRVAVSSLTFTHTGSGTSKEKLDASFTLSAKTPDGHMYSQSFTTTKYLKK